MTTQIEPTDMTEVKNKLTNLREFMPGDEDFIYDFCSYFATRLNPELVPIGFNLQLELTISDCRKGVSGFGERIPSKISGYPVMMYAILKMRMEKVISVVCPKDFADEVLKTIEQIKAQLSRSFEGLLGGL